MASAATTKDDDNNDDVKKVLPTPTRPSFVNKCHVCGKEGNAEKDEKKRQSHLNIITYRVVFIRILLVLV